jgi:hypothetical protein
MLLTHNCNCIQALNVTAVFVSQCLKASSTIDQYMVQVLLHPCKAVPKLGNLCNSSFVAVGVLHGKVLPTNGSYALTADGKLVHILNSGTTVHRSVDTGVRLLAQLHFQK